MNWNSLTKEEKKVWENKAKNATTLHKQTYPNYEFHPVHSKRHKTAVTAEDEKRCGDITQLFGGLERDELATGVEKLDCTRTADSLRPSSSAVPAFPCIEPINSETKPFSNLFKPSPLPEITSSLCKNGFPRFDSKIVSFHIDLSR
jgi:hypothetical protein